MPHDDRRPFHDRAQGRPTVLAVALALAASGCASAGHVVPAIDEGLLLQPDHPAFATRAPDTFHVRLATSQGDVLVEAVRDWAPRGADRFYNLVRAGFYDGNRFFRVLPGFVVQFGLNPDPAVNAAWDTAAIHDDPVRRSNARGTIAFAAAGRGTRTTQLFINLADNPRLDPLGFAPFAAVVEGMHAVDNLYAGYGEGPPDGSGPDQERILEHGEAYLVRDFPELDRIRHARIVATRDEGTTATAEGSGTTHTVPGSAEGSRFTLDTRAGSPAHGGNHGGARVVARGRARHPVKGGTHGQASAGAPAGTAPAVAANQDADPADVASQDAIIGALYDVISGPPGPRDWDRFRSLFAPGARLAAVRPPRDGQPGGLWVGSPDDYVERNGPFFLENGFFESELARTSERFGGIAHAFSTYESRREPGAEPFARGINSIQLHHDGRRWWIVTVLWDSERPGQPIPPRYLP